MRSKINSIILILITFLSPCLTAFSQNKENGSTVAVRLYNEGVALFEERNYGSAIHVFEELQEKNAGLLSEASDTTSPPPDWNLEIRTVKQN